VRSHLGEFAWETRFESRQFGSPTEAINVVVQSQPRLDGAVWDAARPKSGPAGITGSSRLHRQWRELCARAQLLYLKTGRLLDLAGRDNVLVWSGPQGDCLRLVDTIPISAGADPVPHLEVMRRGLGQTR
jgi:hypothetical protein